MRAIRAHDFAMSARQHGLFGGDVVKTDSIVQTCDLDAAEICEFRQRIYLHYDHGGRMLPWRRTRDPYKILVSELMLQQTQVERVLTKYELFLKEFPSFSALAKVRLKDVLAAWQGLGYNKRAIALKKIAEHVDNKLAGSLPSDYVALVELPGIGPATACAVLTFAFDILTVFIETNIRSVFLHVFFAGERDVKDAKIYPLVECTLDRSNPRAWYYALMDYGAMLKKRFGNPNRSSTHRKQQAPFEGSNRQLRGEIISLILADPAITETDLALRLEADHEKISYNLQKLEIEGFFKRINGVFIVG
jgi:A/G-specific adenine glycosylase